MQKHIQLLMKLFFPQERIMINKCLIIDDASIIRNVLSEIIKRYFPEIKVIREAKHGEDALKILEKEKFDFIFLDIHMPKVDGIKTLHAINLLYKNRMPFIIVLTADPSEIKKMHLLELGAKEFLEKPFTPEKIVSLLKSQLTKQGGSLRELL